jgi:hypothetical protein
MAWHQSGGKSSLAYILTESPCDGVIRCPFLLSELCPQSITTVPSSLIEAPDSQSGLIQRRGHAAGTNIDSRTD